MFYRVVALMFSVLATTAKSAEPNYDSCNSLDADIRYGPSDVLKNLTRPEYYDFRKRPNSAYIQGGEASHTPDKTWIALHMRSLVNIDQIDQTISSSFLEEVTWKDHRLRYNISDEAKCVFPIGLDSTRSTIPFNKELFEGIDRTLWVPSTTIINTVDKSFDGDTYGLADPDGTIHKFRQQDITTACPMHFGKYPFDTHHCHFEVSTFMHSDSDIRLIPGGGKDNGTQLIDFKQFDTFQLGQFEISKETSTTSFIDDYYSLRGHIAIKRAGNIFDVEIMIPDILLHISIYASFWIPADSPPARVSLCIISALSFRILRTSISSALPPVSYPLWVVNYMEVSQAIALIALIQYAFVAYLLSVQLVRHSKFKQIKTSNIPGLVKNSPPKAAVLFNEANQQYLEFCAQAKVAQKQRVNAVGALVAVVKRISNRVSVEGSLASLKKRMTRVMTGETDTKVSPVNETMPVGDHYDSSFEDSFEASFDCEGQQHVIIPELSHNATAAHENSRKLHAMNNSRVNQQQQLNTTPSTTPKSSRKLFYVRSSLGDGSPGLTPMSDTGLDSANATPKIRRQPSRVNHSFNELKYSLTMAEVMTIAHARTAFRLYDEDGEGLLCISGLQNCLRHFAKYYSTNQCCALVASYRQSQGLLFDQNPVLNLADFYCLLVELDKHEPLPEFYSSEISTIAPALLMDVIARVLYPIIVAVKIAFFFAILGTY